jgi:mono/diheme cytochrome c family protein
MPWVRTSGRWGADNRSPTTQESEFNMLRKILIALALLVVAVVAAVPAYFYGLHPRMRRAPEMTAPNTPEALERGRYLAEAMAGCIACHSPIDESKPGDFPQAGLE